MKLIRRVEASTPSAACVLFEEGSQFYALSNTPDAIVSNFSCRHSPLVCDVTFADDAGATVWHYFAEVDASTV